MDTIQRDKKHNHRQRSNSGGAPALDGNSWAITFEDLLSKKFGTLEKQDPNIKKLTNEERKILENLAGVGISAEDILEVKSRKRSSSVEEKKQISFFDPQAIGPVPQSEYRLSLLTTEQKIQNIFSR